MEQLLDPHKYFKFNSCSRCLTKPCNRLRFGGVHPGKFILLYQSGMGANFWDCPFTIRNPEEIDTLLESASSEDLIDRIDTVLQSLSPYELLQVRQYDFMSGVSDFPAVARFIKDLWESQVIAVLRIPHLFKNDAKVRKWLYAYEGLDYFLHKPDLANKGEKAAVTDSLADAQKETLNNPRWEHKDEDRAKAGPDVAAIGDSVVLMASAQGFADGAEVSFDIFDASGESPEKIDSASGTVDAGRAEATWVVSDPNQAGDKLALQFEAIKKSLDIERSDFN